MIKVHLGKTLLRPFYENFESSHDGSSVSHLGDVFLPGFPRLISSYSSLPYFQKQAGWGTWLAITYFPPIITVSTHSRDSQLQSTSFSTIMAPFSSWPSMLSYLWRARIVFNTPPFSCVRPTSAWQGRSPVYSLSVCTCLLSSPSKLLHLLRQEGHPPPPLAAKHTSGIIMNSPPALTWSWDCKEEQILPNWNPITISALLTKRHTQLQTCSIFLLIALTQMEIFLIISSF